MKKITLLFPLLLSISACGGGSSSSGSGSTAEERNALECLSFGNDTVINSCDYPIIARTFAGTSTPVTVPANSTVPDPDANAFGYAGACRSPYTPVSVSATEFDCQ